MLKLPATDNKEIDELIAEFYCCFQFTPGDAFNFDSLRTIFHPQARITPPLADTAGTLRSLSVERFIQYCQKIFADVRADGGKERQLSANIEVCGNLAEVFSRYEFVIGYGGPARRGTNRFQLVKDSSRWWIMALTWDREKN